MASVETPVGVPVERAVHVIAGGHSTPERREGAKAEKPPDPKPRLGADAR